MYALLAQHLRDLRGNHAGIAVNRRHISIFDMSVVAASGSLNCHSRVPGNDVCVSLEVDDRRSGTECNYFETNRDMIERV